MITAKIIRRGYCIMEVPISHPARQVQKDFSSGQHTDHQSFVALLWVDKQVMLLASKHVAYASAAMLVQRV